MASKPLQRNGLLATLSREDLRLLQCHLDPVDLRLRQVLEEPEKPIRHVYFLESGLASVLVKGGGESRTEACLIGPEGMTGLPILLLTDRTSLEAVVQVPGSAQCMPAEALAGALQMSDSLRRCLLNYAHRTMIQIAHAAFANARHKVEERLARWLLMAHDRLGQNDLPLTHELLSVMLGVRRTGVTEAVQVLEGARVIIARRGVITVRDRKGLERCARGAYRPPDDAFHQGFGRHRLETDQGL